MEHIKNPELRSEIRYLGTILGNTIRELEGDEAFSVVEELRKLAWDRRTGVEHADERMTDKISSLSVEQLFITTESIRVRNRFIDPLNLTQVELLRRSRQPNLSENQAEELRHLTRLTINGVAAGMRTSG